MEATERLGLGEWPMELNLWHRWVRPTRWPDGALELPLHQVHRGFHLEGVRENTSGAFREAKRRGAVICECDVQMNADGEPVVIHDPDLKRLHGRADRVRELSTAECRRLADIPTLLETLTDTEGPRSFNIELKTRRVLRSDLPAKVAAVIRRADASGRVMISSFNPFALRELETLLPEVPRALLVTNVVHPGYSWVLRRMLVAPFLKLHMLNLDKRMLTPEVVAFWNAREMPLSAWTVNDRVEIQELLKLGVRSVISDLAPSE